MNAEKVRAFTQDAITAPSLFVGECGLDATIIRPLFGSLDSAGCSADCPTARLAAGYACPLN